MKRESLLFYRSFYEAIKGLPKRYKLEAYEAVLAYGLDGTEPSNEGVVGAIFALVRPQIDANNKRYLNGVKGAEHGAKGGRPKHEQEQPKQIKKPKAISLDFIENEEARAIVERWLEYKKSIGNTYKSIESIKAMTERLNELSGGDLEKAKAIVEQSIANNWKGLFKLKQQKTNKNGTNGFDFEAIAKLGGEL